MRRVGVVAFVTAVLLVPVSLARASYDPVGAGSVKVTMSKAFAAVLASHGVKIEPKGGVQRRGRRLTFPASGGEVDPALGAGSVEAQGSITLAGRRPVVLRQVVFKSKRSPLYAKVSGSQLKLAQGARVTSGRFGFGAKFRATGLRLSSKAASRLNKKLGLGGDARPGMLLAVVAAVAQPATVHVAEGSRVSVAIDPAFAAKLNGLFVSVNPIAPAELAPGPAVTLPIGAESILSPQASAGVLKLGGAVELLQLGSSQMFWRELWVEPASAALVAETDTEPAPPHPGPQPRGPLLALGADGAATADPASRTIELQGRSLSLTPATATLLNSAFAEGKDTFAPGERAGVLSFKVAAE